MRALKYTMLPFLIDRTVVVTAYAFPRAYKSSVCSRVAIQCIGSWRLFSSSNDKKGVTEIEISPLDHNTKPIQQYSSQELDARLAQSLKAQGIQHPTPIQAYGIPLLREGHDVMASAQTGTGKTLLFGIPILEKIWQTSKTNQKSNGPTALILNPTRELALQTANAIEALVKKHQPEIKVALATGGASVVQQRNQIERPHDILVATPGRLLMFTDERKLSLQNVQYVVCDESDRMVDLGFEPQLRRIAKALGRNQQKQTLLCSATFPPEVQRIASDFLKPDYYFIAAGRVGATHTSISQTLRWTDSPQQKSQFTLEEIKNFLTKQQSSSLKSTQRQQQSQVIVFCNTKDESERIGNTIQKQVTSKVRIVTGDKAQSERNRSLEDFRSGKVQILVATDVAARGLDVPTIGLVVQVDMPRDVDTYTHRVGRTGRAGASGNAVAFVDGRSIGIATSMVDLLNEANQQVPSWLRGMSYVHRARVMEEEVAIAAGGGAPVELSGVDNKETDSESSERKFSGQDFRSTAEAGSWGSERDTSYRSFDDEAYSTLDTAERVAFLNETEQLSVADEDQFEEITSDESETSFGEDIDELSTDLVGVEALFEQPKPSKGLQDELKRVSGSADVSSPIQNVYSKLSQRNVNQRLRFEYLGLFPFGDVTKFLVKKRDGNDAGGPGDSKIPTVLMIAEKPSIAKAIAEALSGPNGPRQKRGISRALPVYEFTSTKFAPSRDNGQSQSRQRHMIVVTSVVGHVFSLGFDNQTSGGKQDPADYFHLPVAKQEEGSTAKLRVVEHLQALAGNCDHLVLWLDNDAEGENIAHECIGVTRRAIDQKVAQDALNDPSMVPQRRVHRAKFSAISKEALIEAFANLGETDALLSQSVDARQELDLRVGVALTRLLSWRCVGIARSRFSPTTKFLSYGPCQTPALTFCKDRANEIEAFEPQHYWKVNVATKSPAFSLSWIPPAGSEVASSRKQRTRRKDGEIIEAMEDSASYDMSAAENTVELASKKGVAYVTVADVETQSETINAPLGLNTVALLSAGSKAMGMSPKKVLQVAESLYSKGYISYPRTETTKYDPLGFDARVVLRDHCSHPNWGKTASFLLRNKYKNHGQPPKRGRNVGDHPPITCLKAATREEIGGGAEWRVYEFVARTFLGSMSDELEFTRKVAHLDLESGDGENTSKFQIEQIQVDKLGFAGACPWVLKDIGAENDEAKRDIQLQKGMELQISSASLESCQTKPPRFLQEHELIELMDQNRIGTDASMATHVNNIVERGYVVLCDENGDLLRPPRPLRPGQKPLPRQVGRYLVPTSLGTSILGLFDNNKRHGDSLYNGEDSPAMLTRPSIRAQMENEVKEIALGKLDKKQCLQKNLAWFEARYKELEASLSRSRTQEFGQSLVPVKESLGYWKRRGAFENNNRAKSFEGGPRKSNGKHASRPAQANGNSSGKKRPGQFNRAGNKQTSGRRKTAKKSMP